MPQLLETADFLSSTPADDKSVILYVAKLKQACDEHVEARHVEEAEAKEASEMERVRADEAAERRQRRQRRRRRRRRQRVKRPWRRRSS